jgi:hypothetical protein
VAAFVLIGETGLEEHLESEYFLFHIEIDLKYVQFSACKYNYLNCHSFMHFGIRTLIFDKILFIFDKRTYATWETRNRSTLNTLQ